VLLAVVVLVLYLAVARLAGVRLPGLGVQPELIIAAAGAFAAVLILYRLVDPPSPGFQLGVGAEVGRRFGLLVALLASAGISYGGYRALAER
jgi:hypothetical protein